MQPNPPPNPNDSTYIVNRRRKEANIQPLQECIKTIEQQLDHLHILRSSIAHLTLPAIQVPNLSDLSLQSILRQQEVTLQEVKANIERSIDTIIGIPEDVDPTADNWISLAHKDNHQGNNLITNPIIYLPIFFNRAKDNTGTLQSIPINPSDYLPTDEAYFEHCKGLDPVHYTVSSHSSYLQTHKTRTYYTGQADFNTNKYFCRLDPPPINPNHQLLLPHLGDTYLRNGEPFYKRLSIGDYIYIPETRIIGRVHNWAAGIVEFQPSWYFSNLSSTPLSTDHWRPAIEQEPNKTIPFGQFVIALQHAHPTRKLFAHVSPYTAEDSYFLG